MTIPTEVTEPDVYAGDGTTTDFPTSFKVLDASHVAVNILLDGSFTEQLLELNVDYTVTGVGNDTATVQMVTAPAVGDLLSLALAVPITQEADYTNNDPFDAEVNEGALDKGTQIDQQLAIESSLAMRFPTTDTGNKTLPAVSERADKLLGFDSNGEPIAVVTGRAQVNEPYQFTIIDGVYDYVLPYEVFNHADLWVQTTGIDVFTTDFTVTSNIEANRTLTFDPAFELRRVVGELCEVRYVGNALLTGQVADGAINDPDKLVDGVVTLPKLASNAPHYRIGYDASGNPAAVLEARIGSIHYSSGTTIWNGYLECTGQAVSRTLYAALFAELGTIHGPGDGFSTFNLPDYRGRSHFGRGQGFTKNNGASIGTNRVIGEAFGSEDVVLAPGNNAPHAHSLTLNKQRFTANAGGEEAFSPVGTSQGLVTSTSGNGNPLSIQSPGIAGLIMVYAGVYT